MKPSDYNPDLDDDGDGGGGGGSSRSDRGRTTYPKRSDLRRVCVVSGEAGGVRPTPITYQSLRRRQGVAGYNVLCGASMSMPMTVPPLPRSRSRRRRRVLLDNDNDPKRSNRDEDDYDDDRDDDDVGTEVGGVGSVLASSSLAWL